MNSKTIKLFSSRQSIPLLSLLNVVVALIVLHIVIYILSLNNITFDYKRSLIFTVVISFSASLIIFPLLYKVFSLLRSQNDKLLELTDKLHESHVFREALFSVISHDIRSPLTALNGLIDSFVDKDLDADIVEELLGDIYKQNSSLLNMVDSLLQWSKRQIDGDEELYKEQIPLNSIVEPTLELYKQHALNKGVAIENQITDEVIYVDRDSITLVLRNLISNALKYVSPKVGKVKITANQSERYLDIHIIDNGIGMSREKMDEILECGTLSRSHIGTDGEIGHGIGLFLSCYFIDKNGGELRCDSIEGEGTTFSVRFPLV